MKKMKASTVRALVMLAVVVVVAIGYFTSFGIGNVSAFGIDAFSLLCPLGYLESLLASKVFVPRALISFVAVVVLVVILGRVFCAWVCPMPHLQKIFPGIKRKKKGASGADASGADAPGSVAKVVTSEGQTAGTCEDGASAQAATMSVADTAMKSADTAAEPAVGAAVGHDEPIAKVTADAASEPAGNLAEQKPNKFRFDSRFGVLLGALGSAAIFGFPVFCLICPVGLSFATVYLIMRLFAFGEATWTVIFVPTVLLIEVVFFRKWCGKICPLGAIMSLISGANKTLRPTIDDGKCLNSSKGINCLMCAKSCPEGINIRKPEKSATSLNNCTKCRECSDACPAAAISFPLFKKKADEMAASQEERPE